MRLELDGRQLLPREKSESGQHGLGLEDASAATVFVVLDNKCSISFQNYPCENFTSTKCTFFVMWCISNRLLNQ